MTWAPPVETPWLTASEVTETVTELHQRCMAAYQANPDLIEEHFGIERSIAEGGYGRRQIYELVQNGADAALDAGLDSARIAVVLTSEALYCANEGDPITPDGVRAILGSHRSLKRGNQIGRFGLGFKSVLAVTEAPEFFSRSGSMRFDPRRASEDIAAVGDTTRVPSLRLAYPLDPNEERRRDPVLAELMDWAATVVRLPLGAQQADWLHDDIRAFPTEFMLFSAHIGRLELQDRVTETARSIGACVDGDEVELDEDGTLARWRIVSTEYKISDVARQTAGELSERETLPLVWAVPLSSTAERGWFWAFFPTEYWTTMRGIINAPWKTNSDRQNLLRSEFNSELIKQAAELVAMNLEALGTPDDPGRYLDYLPGRGRESPQWADKYLTEEVYELALYANSVPDLDGVFHRPEKVRLHPAGLPATALELFATGSSDRAWAHPSVDSRSRRSRIERIIEGSDQKPIKIDRWFKTIVEHSASPGLPALIAASLREADVAGWEHVPFIPTTSGDLVACAPDTVFFGTGHSAAVGVHLVDSEYADDPAIREALTSLGIRTLDVRGQLEALIAGSNAKSSDMWPAFWELSRQLDNSDVVAVLRKRETLTNVRALTRSGCWAHLYDVLIPGTVVAIDSTENAAAALDMVHHDQDLELLQALGATREPVTDRDPRTESWFPHYRRAQVKRFLAQPSINGRKPVESLLTLEETGYAGPCGPLPQLSGDALVEFGTRLLALPAACSTWAMRHSSQDYGVMACANPALWMLREHGIIATSLGDFEVPQAVGPALALHGDLLPVADVSQAVAEQLELPSDTRQIVRGTWKHHIASALNRPQRLGGLLELAVNAGQSRIASVELDSGEFDLTEVVVCGPQDDVVAIDALNITYAVVREAATAQTLRDDWGYRSATDFYSTRVVPIDANEPVPATDFFPDLAALDPNIGALQIVACDEVVVERSSTAGTDSTSVTHRLQDGVLYVAGGPGNESAILEAIVEAKGWQLDQSERDSLIKASRTPDGRAVARSVADAATIEEKILAAVGRDALVRRLPRQVIEEVEARQQGKPLTDAQLAGLASTIHGVEILSHHRDDMVARGIEAPRQWAGGYTTRKFVLSLGFPEEYAGFQSQSRDPLLHIPGRPSMPPLHDFQATASRNIRTLLAEGKGRGLLSLPTGAGKTRTAVQAIVEAMRDDGLTGPVLWVAQTDELCEQAVSAWADNWRAIGPRQTLKLARLWSSNEAQDLGDPHHVIVATMAKLEAVMGKSEYMWLSKATAVVIDEAHRATASSYTKLLGWLDMSRGKERIPLIGLTATPYRGTSVAETETLVRRFNQRRLDGMDGDPYAKLQDMGVLSRVEHRLLAGSDIALNAGELDALRKTNRLPASVLERVGEDKGRNQKILESMIDLPKDFTVLLFAASVTHAELMASLLSLEGIPSRSISARTDRGARQHYIEQFRKGEIRVLTNYGVLTEGFDAPAVRAVYVTRPTYSPNVYQQMIGRGLRGPRNGGKELCLIVNVEDNLAAYGEDLAFAAFEHLWSDS